MNNSPNIIETKLNTIREIANRRGYDSGFTLTRDNDSNFAVFTKILLLIPKSLPV